MGRVSLSSLIFLILVIFSHSLMVYADQGQDLGVPSKIQGTDLLSGGAIEFSLKSLPAEKKGIVFVFLSAVCPCSDSHVPELKNLAKKYKDFQFVGIHSNVNETKEVASAYFKKAALPFAMITDPDAKIADVFKASKTPHAFLFDRNGKLVYRGGVTSSALADQAEEKYLQEALLAVNEGKTVKNPFGRTLGCVISRSKD